METPETYNTNYGDLISKLFSYTTDNTIPDHYLRTLQSSLDQANAFTEESNPKKRKEKHMSKRRLVDVYIVDNDPNLQLDKCVLHKELDLLTEDEDQDIFFSLNMKELLDKHNVVRSETIDEKATEKKGEPVYLKPIKPSKLQMQIITKLSF